MATMRIPPNMNPDQSGNPRRTIFVDGVERDVSIPWRGVVQLNTGLANQLWALRGGNPRPFSKHLAGKYADDIRLGGWGQEFCSPLSITSDGTLGDGQHRVAGVLASGMSIMVELALGVDPNAVKYMDSGRARSLAIRVKIDESGERSNRIAGSIAKVLVKVTTSNSDVSVRDMEAIRDEYAPSIRIVSGRIASIHRSRGIGRAGFLAALVVYHNTNPTAATEFMDSYFVPGGDVQPAVMLRDYALTNAARAGAIGGLDEYERACSAIAAHLRGEDVKQLKRRKEHPCGPIKFSRPRGEKLDWSFV